jgi:anti-sigma regulatory factor (Ser/Thr protein kinase)
VKEQLFYRSARDEGAPKLGRAVLRGVLQGADLAVVHDAELLGSELMTNAVRYGAGEVTLTIHVQEDRLNVAVSDEGTAKPARPA